MAKEKNWGVPLGTRGDVAHFRVIVDRGRVIEFAIHDRALIGDREVDVLRYDTCDGHLHVHRVWLDPPNDRMALESRDRRASDYSEHFTEARADLLANWKQYRAQMELMG